MPGKLKVYRTAIGFHDAYVAAASQRAALEAWGTDKPLFARGAAEQVTDPELTAEPLASPGEVVKRLRGTAAEQMAAALPRDKPKVAKRGRAPVRTAASNKAAPKPSRAELDAAERSVEEAEAQQREQLDAIAKRETALREERRALERDRARERDRLIKARDRAAEAYRAALDARRD